MRDTVLPTPARFAVLRSFARGLACVCRWSAFVAGACVVLLAAPALAAQQTTTVQRPAIDRAAPPKEASLAGNYELASADGMRSCPITLTENTRGPASTVGDKTPLREVTLDRAACGQIIVFSTSIAGWSPGPGHAIRLHDAQGALVAEFTEGVDGTWEALRDRDGVYFLVNPLLAAAAEPAKPTELFGLWNLGRTVGRPACRVRLSDARAQPGAYRLDPDAACHLLFGRFMPGRWRIERGDLVLESAGGGALRFAPNEEGGWAKVPEDSRPLFLTRVP
jgi:hypothetical protein